MTNSLELELKYNKKQLAAKCEQLQARCADLTRKLELAKLAEEYDAAPEDAGWGKDHPIFQMAANIDRLESEKADLEKLVYVPGLWRCAKCNFELIQANLNANDGTVTARDQPGDKCPNCKSPLWRVTERQSGEMVMQRLEEMCHEKAELDIAAKEFQKSIWRLVGEKAQQQEHIKKLARRIHNQRVALRDNWEVVEMRRNEYCGKLRPLRSKWWDYIKSKGEERAQQQERIAELKDTLADRLVELVEKQERIAAMIDKDALISSVLHYRDTFHDGDDEFDAGGRYAIKMVIKMANEGKFNPTKPTPHPAESENSNG